jgi:hypothetical protein
MGPEREMRCARPRRGNRRQRSTRWPLEGRQHPLVRDAEAAKYRPALPSKFARYVMAITASGPGLDLFAAIDA